MILDRASSGNKGILLQTIEVMKKSWETIESREKVMRGGEKSSETIEKSWRQ